MTAAFEPAYVTLHRSGELRARAAAARERLADCDLCARHCRVDRLAEPLDKGALCRTGALARVASFAPHFGEEEPLSGSRGSGTIFFSWCNLRCVFCQNWEISWRGAGVEVSPGRLAEMMLSLQAMGCHNVNFVSPSHVIAPILEALVLAVEGGLRLPLVYNTGGYDSPEGLALLDGVIDIYMPDMKYADDEPARTYSRARGYPAANFAAVKEMHRQVGNLKLTGTGTAVRGLLVRHLVMPGGVSGSGEVFRFLADEISPDTYLNVMAQYRPCYRAGRFPPLERGDISREYREALELAHETGLRRLDRRVTGWGLFNL